MDRKRNYQKLEKDKPNKFRKVDCIRCGAPNWSKLHDCPAKAKNCLNCGKIGHRRIKHIHPESEASSAEDDWSPNRIHIITRMVHSTKQTLECSGKPYLLKAQHSAFNISDSTTIPLTVQNWQITSFVPDSTDLVVDSSNKCLAVRTVGMQRCPGFHKNVSFAK